MLALQGFLKSYARRKSCWMTLDWGRVYVEKWYRVGCCKLRIWWCSELSLQAISSDKLL